METVLNVLYEAFRSDVASPEEQAVLNREEAFLDEMERRLGQKDFTRFWDAVSAIGCCRAEADFRMGLWLGINLILTAKSSTFPQN